MNGTGDGLTSLLTLAHLMGQEAGIRPLDGARIAAAAAKPAEALAREVLEASKSDAFYALLVVLMRDAARPEDQAHIVQSFRNAMLNADDLLKVRPGREAERFLTRTLRRFGHDRAVGKDGAVTVRRAPWAGLSTGMGQDQYRAVLMEAERLRNEDHGR
jgi:hypothetical protein